MHPNSLKFRANRERILAVATRNIAEHGFAHVTRRRVMEGTGLADGSMHPHFPHITHLLAAICERHARALLEATGCVDPVDPMPPPAPPWSRPRRASSPASTPAPTPTPS
jgi:AcrR family transcriptional regulator